LTTWAERHRSEIAAAREAYDREHAPAQAPVDTPRNARASRRSPSLTVSGRTAP
jgi:hypothetical protein